MPEDSKQRSFWTSLPGVLTGLAAVVTAGTGLYLALDSVARQHPKPSDQPPPSTPTLSAPSASGGFTGPMGPLEPGVSYSGGDLYDQPAETAEFCAQLCANDNRCAAVTFIISQKRCWLKNRINPPQQSSDMISSRRLS